MQKKIRTVRSLLEASMKYVTDEHGLTVNISNRGNTLITTDEPNLNSYFNEIIKFAKPFITIIVGYKTGFYLQDNGFNSYEIPPCCSKGNFTAPYC